MAAKMRRNFSGSCSASFAADGTWRITQSRPHETEIIVVGADSRSAQACGTTLHDLGIEWQGQRVLLTMMSAAGRVATLEAASAIVHEPLGNLYAALPLAEFDGRARRFWRRVFLLVRIPGGRSLLGILAHASRKRT
jgi:hypothetical protein